MKYKNERTTSWEEIAANIVEYSEGQEGWEIPFSRMQIVNDNLEIIFDGVCGENVIKPTDVKKKFPIKLLGDFKSVRLEMLGELYQPDGQYLGDVYGGIDNRVFMTVVIDGNGKPLLYYDMRFIEDWEIDFRVKYDNTTGGFKLDIPIIQ